MDVQTALVDIQAGWSFVQANSDFGHPGEQLSGLHKDLKRAIRGAGPNQPLLDGY
jgi:hypothetical protein